MKKLFLLAAAAFLFQGSVSAQTGLDAQQAAYQPKSHFEIGIGGISRVDFKRAGISGNVKWILPTKDEEGNGFLITAKATHLPSNKPGTGFFDGFDKGKSNNISSLFLMLGYRVYILDNPKPNSKLFFEFNMGLAQEGTLKTGLGINPLFGFQFTKHFAITLGAQGSIVNKASNLGEVGLSYRF